MLIPGFYELSKTKLLGQLHHMQRLLLASPIDGDGAMPCLPRAASCHRAGRTVPSPRLVPGVRPKARPMGRRVGLKARRATGPRSCLMLQQASRMVGWASSRSIFSFFRISRLHFLPGHSGWMDGPLGLHFFF
jgi:hypothetical protein